MFQTLDAIEFWINLTKPFRNLTLDRLLAAVLYTLVLDVTCRQRSRKLGPELWYTWLALTEAPRGFDSNIQFKIQAHYNPQPITFRRMFVWLGFKLSFEIFRPQQITRVRWNLNIQKQVRSSIGLRTSIHTLGLRKAPLKGTYLQLRAWLQGKVCRMWDMRLRYSTGAYLEYVFCWRQVRKIGLICAVRRSASL